MAKLRRLYRAGSIFRPGGQRGKGTINVSVHLDPSPAVLAKQFDGIEEKLRDFRPVWEKMIPKLRRHMGKVWGTQGAAAGKKWPPWKRSYAKRRPNGSIGVLTGKLLNQLISRGVLSKTKTSLRFGARGPGVRAFHFGGAMFVPVVGKGKMVTGQRPRPYVVATPGVMRIAAWAWQDHILDVMEQWPIKGTGRGQANAMIRRKAA